MSGHLAPLRKPDRGADRRASSTSPPSWATPTSRERPDEQLRGLDVLAGAMQDRWRARRLSPARLMLRANAILDHASTDATPAHEADARLHDRSARFAQGRIRPADVDDALRVLVRIAERTVGLRAHPNQVAAALAIEAGAMVELATGEGKTLAAALAAAMLGWRRRGVHVVTANDYLAERDAAWAAPLLNAVGLSVASIAGEASPTQRRAAYACDVTYATSREFAADLLRTRLSRSTRASTAVDAFDALAQRTSHRHHAITPCFVSDPGFRGPACAVVDEADFVLLDDAVTPLVLSTSGAVRDAGDVVSATECADDIAKGLVAGQHFSIDDRTRDVRLTAAGRRIAEGDERWAGRADVLPREREHLVTTAIAAHDLFREGVEYIIDDGRVVIVDPATGRTMADRTWRAGLHQAVEAKHGLASSTPSKTVASISFQRFFRLYPRLSGLTGTAMSARHEVRRVYRLPTVSLPTHAPDRRKHERLRVFCNAIARDDAAAHDAVTRRAVGQPVLVGCDSVERARSVSRRLHAAGSAHVVLSAEHAAEEATVIAHAGRSGAVTVATPMAGRGADIALDDTARAAGGLAVVTLAMARSPRIDRQYIGRAGRQGDPGVAAPLASLDDEVLRRHRPALARLIAAIAGSGELRGVRRLLAAYTLRSAQRQSELAATRMRKRLLRADEDLDTALGFARPM